MAYGNRPPQKMTHPRIPRFLQHPASNRMETIWKGPNAKWHQLRALVERRALANCKLKKSRLSPAMIRVGLPRSLKRHST